MKLLIETINKEFEGYKADGLILSLKDFSVNSIKTYTIKEIEEIINKTNYEIFININKNMFNSDIEKLKEKLIKLSKLNIKAIFFYDLAILQLKKELNLNINLVWDQSHMVNNKTTCDYYYEKGVKYALLSKEITLEEIKEIITESKIKSMVEVLSLPAIAYSKRKLINNYYEYLKKPGKEQIEIYEKITKKTYIIRQTEEGSAIYQKEIMNGTSIINELYNIKTPYIIFREFGIDNFKQLVNDTKEYINNNCLDNSYVEKYKKYGDNTNFFYKKTVYMVKKNAKK